MFVLQVWLVCAACLAVGCAHVEAPHRERSACTLPAAAATGNPVPGGIGIALTQAPVGRGITEMRERTELFGGVFTATTVPGVGFSISAIFPSLKYHNGVHGVKLDQA